MYVYPAFPWQNPRLRRRRWHLLVLKRAACAFLLLAGSMATRPVYADTMNWTLAADGEWNVAANWTASSPPTQREPTINDDMFNNSGYTITLSGTGYANTFTTNSNFILTGTLNLNSLLSQNSGSVVSINSGHLVFQQSGTISGGNITMNGGYVGGQYGTTLTLNSNTFAHGGGSGVVGGYVYSSYYDAYLGGSLINNGTISADVNGQSLYVQPGYNPGVGYGTFSSTGTLQATNGGTLFVNQNGGGSGGIIGGSLSATGNGSALYLSGTENLTDGTTFSAGSNGKIYLSGNYDNQNHTVNLIDGSFSMLNGALRNTTVNVSGTGVGLDFSTGNGTLDNVTLNGILNVSSNYAYIYNNLTVTGGVSITNGGHLLFQTDSMLGGSNMTINNGYVGGQYGTTFTIGSNMLLHGGNNGYVGAYNSSLYGGNIVNNGTISADMGIQALYVQPGYNPSLGQYSALTNNGTLQAANGGTLRINQNGGSGTSTGTIRADVGSNIFISSVTQTAGSTVVNGTLNTNMFILQGGTLVGNGTVSGSVQNQGATVSAGSAPHTAGTLTFANNYAQNSGSIFQVDLGGTAQGVNYDLLKVNGTATLAGQLQVQLLNGFTPYVGETFNILNYNNRQGAFSNIFAPDGDTYSLTYNDTNGVATLHVLTVAPVPEAGTLVSLGLLVAAGVFRIRRKTRQAKTGLSTPPFA